MARAGDALFEVRAARVEPVGTGMLELRLTVRMTNRGRYPAVFSSSVFRLLADGTAVAPTGETTSEAVDGNSAKDGLVVFVLPDTTLEVVLQVGEVGRVTNTIPLALRDGQQ